VVSHRAIDADGLGVRGYLFVEPRRHVQSWDLMSATEVVSVAEAAWLAARRLRRLLDVEGVYTAIIGRQIDHVHQHVFARHVGTPDDVGWLDSPSWGGVPRVSAAELETFAQRVGAAINEL
jgi:ATP adenylyltransferase